MVEIGDARLGDDVARDARIHDVDTPARHLPDMREDLLAGARTLPKIIAKTSRPPDLEKLKQMNGVQKADLEYGGCTLQTTNVSQTIIELVGHLQEDKIELWDIHIHRPSLEDLFIELTGRDIRQ